MSTPDIHSLPNPEYDFELSELDLFGLELRNALELLDDRQTTPSTETLQLGSLPFGRFQESKLSCYLGHDQNLTTGTILFKSAEDASKTMRLERSDPASKWAFPDGTTRSNKGILQLLDRNWPIANPNDDLSLFASLDEPDDRTVLDCALTAVAPFAPDVIRERTYAFTSNYSEDSVDKSSVPTQLILQRKDEKGLTTVHAVLEIPYSIRHKITPLTCVISSDELGTTTLAAHYVDPGTDQIITLNINSETAMLNEFRSIIDQLLDEKLSNTNSL